MKCSDISEMLSPYIDGMLESSQVVEVEEHLAGCASCRSAYEELLAAVDLVRGLPEVEPPADFHDNLRQKLRTLPVPAASDGPTSVFYRPAWRKWTRTLAVAAVVLLAVGITALWYEHQHDGWLPDAGQQIGSSRRAVDQGITGQDQAAVSEQRDKETTQEQEAVPSVKTDELSGASNESAQEPEPEIFSDPGEPPAPEQQQLALRDTGEALAVDVDDSGLDADAAGEELRKDLMAGNYVEPGEQPAGGSDSPFTIMSVPWEEVQDNDVQTEKKMMRAGVGLSPASVYTATVTLNVQPETASDWGAIAGSYGGFVEAEPQQTGAYWVLRIPMDGVDGFLTFLNNMGQAEVSSSTRDITSELSQAEEQLNNLLEQQKRMVQTEDGAGGTAELDALRRQIDLQQEAVEKLRFEIVLAKIYLNIK